MTKILPLLFLCLLTVSCQIKTEKSKDTPKEDINLEQIKAVAHLPVHIDSTAYLLHPIGELAEEKTGYLSSGGSTGNTVFKSSDMLRGKMTNIKFQQLNSEEMVALTKEEMLIFSAQFLRSLYETTGKQFLLYELLDQDTNNDGNLDGEDARALYISDISGENFRKLTPAGQHLRERNLVDAMNRLYFKSGEDSNADGKFDHEDRQHLFYIDLAAEVPKVVEYDPLKGEF